ncbi:hypothetical protein KA977_08990 [Candidatus Dependentiae bacterium]|nr:hypothetical protein [Candidatus Dependentiae bacterium]
MDYIKLFDKKIYFSQKCGLCLNKLFPDLYKDNKRSVTNELFIDLKHIKTASQIHKRPQLTALKQNGEEYLINDENKNNKSIAEISNYNLNFIKTDTPIFYVKPALRFLLQLYLEKKLNGISLHSSAIEYKNKIILFCGKNNAGKTTISSKLADSDSNINLLSNDTILLKTSGTKTEICSHPFFEKFFLFNKIDCIIFLNPVKLYSIKQKNSINSELKPASQKESIINLLQNLTYCYYDDSIMEKILKNIIKINNNIKYKFSYTYIQNKNFNHINKLKIKINNLLFS